MALIKCSKCKAKISDKAKICPKCGNRIYETMYDGTSYMEKMRNQARSRDRVVIGAVLLETIMTIVAILLPLAIAAVIVWGIFKLTERSTLKTEEMLEQVNNEIYREAERTFKEVQTEDSKQSEPYSYSNTIETNEYSDTINGEY